MLHVFRQPRQFYRELLHLALPIALQNLINYTLSPWSFPSFARKKRTLSGPFFLYFFRQVSSPSSTSSTRVLPAGKSPRRMDLAISVSALLCRYLFKGRAP